MLVDGNINGIKFWWILTIRYLKASGHQGDLSDLEGLQAMSELLGCIDEAETVLAARRGRRMGEGKERTLDFQ